MNFLEVTPIRTLQKYTKIPFNSIVLLFDTEMFTAEIQMQSTILQQESHEIKKIIFIHVSDT